LSVSIIPQILYSIALLYRRGIRASTTGAVSLRRGFRKPNINREASLREIRREYLLPLYRINAYEDGIRDIAFASDCLRFADFRGSEYRIWESAVLVSHDFDKAAKLS
jgi:hypothetical protein